MDFAKIKVIFRLLLFGYIYPATIGNLEIEMPIAKNPLAGRVPPFLSIQLR